MIIELNIDEANRLAAAGMPWEDANILAGDVVTIPLREVECLTQKDAYQLRKLRDRNILKVTPSGYEAASVIRYLVRKLDSANLYDHQKEVKRLTPLIPQLALELFITRAEYEAERFEIAVMLKLRKAEAIRMYRKHQMGISITRLAREYKASEYSIRKKLSWIKRYHSSKV